jgi:hypothetical protein
MERRLATYEELQGYFEHPRYLPVFEKLAGTSQTIYCNGWRRASCPRTAQNGRPFGFVRISRVHGRSRQSFDLHPCRIHL